ncbi:MAG: OmpA family protein [Crocinitomicaceae bacterium]
MKSFSLLTMLLLSGVAISQQQKPNYNRWSIDAAVGLNKAVRNFAPGYSSGLASIGETNFGVRYMLNPYAGLDLKFGFDRFQDSKSSPDFATNLGRVSLDGIINVGNTLKFYQWTNRIGLLFHAGVGVGNMVDKGFPLAFSTVDKVGSVNIGLTPQIKLSQKWSLNFDATITGLARMHHTFDYTAKNTSVSGNSKGFNGQFFSGTIGISYYLGKKGQHADWSPTKSVSKEELDALRAELIKMQNGLNDDDKDGVPNYIDQEANTVEGTPVNLRGVTAPMLIDTDNDGISDAYDACPNEKGTYSANGCPDNDSDGTRDSKDKCPDVAGAMWKDGCPDGTGSGDQIVQLNPGLEDVYFSVASASLSKKEMSKLDAVVSVMKANPTYKLIVKGHTDRIGSFDYNQNLSEDRADAAKNYLIKKGVDPAQIKTVAYGFNAPANSTNTEKARALNRRVAFEVRK